MKNRLSLLVLGLLLAALPALAQTPPTHVTTTKRSAIAIGSGSFALVKGTKLEIVAREGDALIVKFRTSQGKVPLADTDYPVDAADETEATPVEPPAKAVAATPAAKPAPAPAATKQPAAPVAKATPPPALDPAGKPATNYGKAVQKAKQAAEANKSTHVDPTKEIMDEEPKKK